MVTNRQADYLKSFWGEITQAAEELRNRELPKLCEEDFSMFQKTGNRIIYENVYFTRRKYLTVFGILAEFGKKKEDMDMLADIIDAVCDEDYWALPAHIDFTNPDKNTIDLFAAETAQTLSEMLYIFGDLLPQKIAEKAQNEILKRVLLPFCRQENAHYWWEKNCSNWSAVCGGSVGMSAIYMDRMGKLPNGWEDICIRRVCDALQYYIDGMEDDGVCTEGLGYFSYGMSYYTAFAELLYEESGQKVNLMEQPKCEKIAEFQQKCYFGSGVSLSFSDGSDSERFLAGLTAFLAYQFPKVKTPDYAVARGLEDDNCFRWLPNERNIRWLMRYGKSDEARQEFSSYDLLPSAQWMICRDKYGNGFAAKGGHNDENHNHNDIGHFLCVYEGEMLLTDLGAGEYTKDYFGEGRYEILCNSSLGHSVPLINDNKQSFGREYRADDFLWDEDTKTLKISFAGAYRQGLVKEIVRTIHFKGNEADGSDNEMLAENGKANPMKLEVTDRFVSSAKTEKITENLITAFKPEIEAFKEENEGIITIQGRRSVCRIRVENAADLRIIPKEHYMHDGTPTTVYLIQWEVESVKDINGVKMEITFLEY